MAKQTSKLLKIKPISTPTCQPIPFQFHNKEAWFCYVECEFHEYDVRDSHVHFFAVLKALSRYINRYATPSMFTSSVSEPYNTLKGAILKCRYPTDRGKLDQLLHNVKLQCVIATKLLRRKGGVIGQRTFDDDLVKKLF